MPEPRPVPIPDPTPPPEPGPVPAEPSRPVPPPVPGVGATSVVATLVASILGSGFCSTTGSGGFTCGGTTTGLGCGTGTGGGVTGFCATTAAGWIFTYRTCSAPPVPRRPPPPPPAGPGPPAPCGFSVTLPVCVANGVTSRAITSKCSSAESTPQPRRLSRYFGSIVAGSRRFVAGAAMSGWPLGSIVGCISPWMMYRWAASALRGDMQTYTTEQPRRVREHLKKPDGGRTV